MAEARDRGHRGFQSIPLEDAVGRVASGRIVSGEDLPAFDNSAMDGFALAAAQTSARGPIPVVGRLAAGDAPRCAPAPGAVEIMTGAPMPAGTDAVVKVEDVERLDGGRAIAVREPAEPGDFVRRRGADFAKGDLIAEGGAVLEPRHLMALAALGQHRVSVRLRPRVALLGTGKEIVPYDEKPLPGQLRDATGPYLRAELARLGAQVVSSVRVGDEPAEFRARLQDAIDGEPDLILATGAVSMGAHDYVPGVVEELGAERLFHKVAVRPGKPLLAASVGNGPLFLGLPGNPVSTAMALRFFVTPVLRFFLDLPEEAPRLLTLAETVEKPEGLRCFFKAVEENGKVRCLPGQASFQIKPLLQAGCWAALPEEKSRLAEGETVEVWPL